MEIGIRVVRGPDWQWRNQDDGEGKLNIEICMCEMMSFILLLFFFLIQ